MKSAMDPQVWLFIGVLLVAMCPVYPLPCIPCSEVACTQPVNCKEGMVASVESCGCCSVCAKVEGEVCGGERQEDGSCDSGLVCVVRNRQAGQALGLCEPAICKAKKCGFRKMCILGNNSQPICKCIPSCTSNKHKPVCGYSNGRQYSNECELYRDECTTGRVIGRMQGPCKKCFHAGKTFRFGETRRGKKACDSCRCFHGEWKCHTNTPCPQDIVKSCTMSRDIHGRTVRPRCPKGYWCKVQIPGIPEADIPGVAVCVPGNPPAVTGSTTETSSLPPVQVTTVNRDEKIPSQCLLDVDEGPCRAAFNRWYYDKAKGKCVAFLYGGCDGNANNFYTKPACKNLCVQRNKTAVHTPPPHMANVITQEPLLTMGREFCRLPAVTGPCRASFPRWYYNWSRRKCLKFTYGGCKGNVNNFRTKEDCKRRCMRRKVSSLTSTSVSSSPPSTTAPVNSAEMFYCRCTYCVGQDRCSTSVGCFSSINYSVDGGVVGPPTKGCFNALQYQLQCTVTGSQTLVECCKEDMCNDFTISEDNSKQRQAEIATPSPKTEPAVVTCHDSPSDTFYGEGESWEPNDCTVCVCRSGTPECLATVCRHPDCREPLYIKGQCCPVCPLVSNSSDHNELELIKAFAENKLDTVLVSINHGHHKDVCRDIRSGQVYLVGQSWQLDQCTTCYCGKSGKAACAVQMCERDPQCKNLFHEPNHCCPMCKDEHVVKSTSQCYDTITQKYYQKAELWQRDECTSCYCGSDRKPHCTDTICPPVECDAPLKIEKRCCPVCPDTIQQGCMYDGQKFLHGDLKLLSDQCTLCKCENGDWHCSNDSCLISQVQQDGRQN